MASESKTTTDHDEIRAWAEARDAKPASVSGTGGGDDPGVIRLNFPGYDEDDLEEISWDEFFEKFEENKLAFLYQVSGRDRERRAKQLQQAREAVGAGARPSTLLPVTGRKGRGRYGLRLNGAGTSNGGGRCARTAPSIHSSCGRPEFV